VGLLLQKHPGFEAADVLQFHPSPNICKSQHKNMFLGVDKSLRRRSLMLHSPQAGRLLVNSGGVWVPQNWLCFFLHLMENSVNSRAWLFVTGFLWKSRSACSIIFHPYSQIMPNIETSRSRIKRHKSGVLNRGPMDPIALQPYSNFSWRRWGLETGRWLCSGALPQGDGDTKGGFHPKLHEEWRKSDKQLATTLEHIGTSMFFL